MLFVLARRCWPFVLALALALGLATRHGALSQIDREALRAAATSGDIVLLEREGQDGSRIEHIDAATGEVRLLRQEDAAWLYWPTWASNVQAFACTRIEHGRSDIELIDRTGKSRRKIEVSAWPWVAWRPDSDELAVAGSLHEGEYGIHLLDLKSGRWTRLTEERQEQWLAWSPKGDRLAVSRLLPKKQIYLVDAATRQAKVLCDGAIAVWSPDGRTLAVIGTGRDSIDLVDAETGKMRRLVSTLSCGRLAWSPDGRWLLTDEVRPGQQALVLVSVANGVCVPIGRPANLLHGFSWAARSNHAELGKAW